MMTDLPSNASKQPNNLAACCEVNEPHGGCLTRAEDARTIADLLEAIDSVNDWLIRTKRGGTAHQALLAKKLEMYRAG